MKTAFEKLIDACRSAYMSRVPLLFIRTDELEVVRRLVLSDCLVPRVMQTPGTTLPDQSYSPCAESADPRLRRQRVYGTEIVSTGREVKDLGIVKNVSVYREGSRELWKTDKAVSMPQLFICHVPHSEAKAFSADVRAHLLEFVDLYTASEDDNGVLRSSLVLLYGDAEALPQELRGYCRFIDVALPDREEIAEILRASVAREGLEPLAEGDVAQLAYELSGFSFIEVENLLREILSSRDVDGFNPIYAHSEASAHIIARKRQKLKRENLMELRDVEDVVEIGGMEGLMDWIQPLKACVGQSARLRDMTGLLPTRGVLLCGVPGCGKSLVAKWVAKALKLPLLRLDIGRLMGRYVGQSEGNLARALKQAETMSPCVLWVDEIEKGFENAGGHESEGYFRRMLGHLLTWMQENEQPVFIFATSNDISRLPRELLRSGRFDELFAVEMPLRDECVSILENLMRGAAKRVEQTRRTPLFSRECYARGFLERLIDRLAAGERPRFVTGADLEKIMNAAIRAHWLANRKEVPIGTADWPELFAGALARTTVYGDGMGNLDSVAMCYLKLMYNSFRPAARRMLFSPEEYDEKQNRFRDREDQMPTAYDRALYRALLAHINALAPRFAERVMNDLFK